MKMNTQRITDRFIRLVSIDSPTYGEKEMGAYLKQCLESFGFCVSEDHAGAANPCGCGKIYGFLDGEIKGEPILFCAHMDTVEPSHRKQSCCLMRAPRG